MVRIKRGTTKNKRRSNLLARVKGYRFGRSTKKKQAREAMYHAGNHAFAHRRRKKGDFRKLWTIRLNAALRPFEISYSKFFGLISAKNIGVNRKMLSEMAVENPESFKRVVDQVTK